MFCVVTMVDYLHFPSIKKLVLVKITQSEWIATKKGIYNSQNIASQDLSDIYILVLESQVYI